MCEDTKSKIAIMQAFVDGKKIEYRPDPLEYWTPTPAPVWAWASSTYRIAEDMDSKAKAIFLKQVDIAEGLRAVINAVKAGEIT